MHITIDRKRKLAIDSRKCFEVVDSRIYTIRRDLGRKISLALSFE